MVTASMNNIGLSSVVNPSLMNGNSGSDKKQKAGKVTLDKNGKPKRKKASRGRSAIDHIH
jgi:hypothetical protein